jgi:hypothetical protein
MHHRMKVVAHLFDASAPPPPALKLRTTISSLRYNAIRGILSLPGFSQVGGKRDFHLTSVETPHE